MAAVTRVRVEMANTDAVEGYLRAYAVDGVDRLALTYDDRMEVVETTRRTVPVGSPD